MRIGLILVRHPPSRYSPMMGRVARLLRSWGACVDVIEADENVIDLAGLRPDADLFVLKSGSELALTVAGVLHDRGARLLNPYPVAAACRDKAQITARLADAGLPVPPTWVVSRAELAAGLVPDGPLVVKPVRGSQGRGVRRVDGAALLHSVGPADAAPGAPSEPLLIQRHLPPDGPDHKIYRIGDHVFGVLRPWPATTYTAKLGTPVPVPAEIVRMAEAAGDALGIDLFGFDVVVSRGEPYVVDFSSFPGFKGVPDAALRLADHIYAHARDSTSLRGLASGPGGEPCASASSGPDASHSA